VRLKNRVKVEEEYSMGEKEGAWVLVFKCMEGNGGVEVIPESTVQFMIGFCHQGCLAEIAFQKNV
jgi:hypothetical protein